jgi:hypothetical protein
VSDTEARLWALSTFGVDGVRVREMAPTIVRECHERLANAQVEADMDHQGVYGQIWHRCLNEFAQQLGRLPSAVRVAVPGARYSVAAFGDVVVFPWRYSREAGVEIGSRRFAVSDARFSLFQTTNDKRGQQIDLGFEHPELTEEERDVVAKQHAALAEVMSRYSRVVVVGYASNSLALHNVMWGEAKLGADGYLEFSTSESLIDLASNALVDVNVEESFDSGELPAAVLEVKEAGGTTDA